MIVATCCVATGLYELGRMSLEYRSVWYTARAILTGEMPLFSWVLLFGFPILSLAKVVSGVGLIRGREWSWSVAVLALSTDFLIRLHGHIVAWSSAFLHPEPLPTPAGDGVVVTVSMWPSSIIAVVSLVSVLILLKGTIRRHFRDMSGNEATA